MIARLLAHRFELTAGELFALVVAASLLVAVGVNWLVASWGAP